MNREEAKAALARNILLAVEGGVLSADEGAAILAGAPNALTDEELGKRRQSLILEAARLDREIETMHKADRIASWAVAESSIGRQSPPPGWLRAWAGVRGRARVGKPVEDAR